MNFRERKSYYQLRLLFILFPLLLLCSCAPKNIEAQPKQEVKSDTEPSPSRYEAYYHFTLSRRHFFRGDFKEALSEIETAERLDPSAGFLKYNLALIYMSLNRFGDALEKLEEAVNVTPNFAPAHALLGRIYASSQDSDKKERSVKELTRAIELNPDDVESYLFLGIVQVEAKEYDKAERNFEKVTELIPKDERGYYFLGRLYSETGDFKKSEIYYKRSLELNSGYPSALIDLAVVYEKQGKFEESENIYKQLVVLFPTSFEANLRYGNFLFRLNRLADATTQFKKAEQLDYQNLDLKLRLGLLYLEKKEYDKAIEEFKLILLGNPGDERAKYYLALGYIETGKYDESSSLLNTISPNSTYYNDSLIQRAYLVDKKGNPEESLRIIEEALERNPDNEPFINYLGGLYRKLDRNADAIRLYEDHLKKHPESELVYYSLGVTYYIAKQEDKSIDAMKKVLEINPDNAEALNFIGYTYAERGENLDEAEGLVTRALEISPNKGHMIDSLGWIYYKRGNLDKALEFLHRATQLISDDPTVMEHLGDVYNDKGNTLKALEYYEKSLGLNLEEDKELKERVEKKINLVRQKLNAKSRQEKNVD